MRCSEFPGPTPVFDDAVVDDLLIQVGLPLVFPMTKHELETRLEEVAAQHYWADLTPPEPDDDEYTRLILFPMDAVADASVTPSRLRDRLIGVEQSAMRIVAGTSRRPFVEKLEELLERLGCGPDGAPLKHSGTEIEGRHGRSESNAVWLCLIRAIKMLDSPPRRYRPDTTGRPWPSQRLGNAIAALVRGAGSPADGHADGEVAARDIYRWAAWCRPQVDLLVNAKNSRHHGDPALDATISKLADLFREAFGKAPSAYRRSAGGSVPEPNAWERFLFGAVMRILAPEEPPKLSALMARWRRRA